MNIKEFHDLFPTDDSCLEYILRKKYEGKAVRVKGRLCFNTPKGQIYPLKGTIFEKSTTPLTKWFYALFLVSKAKHGLSSKELQRHLGVTYKCAYRMNKKIRSLMSQDHIKLSGTVEADETYIGGKRSTRTWYRHKKVLVGAMSRNGKVRAQIVSGRSEYQVQPFLEKSVIKGSRLLTDEAAVYKQCRYRWKHQSVNHSKFEFVRGDVHTNSIEGVWSTVKRSFHGTWNGAVKDLQSYVNVLVWHRNEKNPLQALLERL